jgi:hypothetical protein
MRSSMLGSMSNATDYFENLYAVTLSSLGDPKLRGVERTRLAQLLVYLLGEWPERWNERVERELAVWALEHLDDSEAVLALAEAFLGRRVHDPSSPHILQAIAQRAARDGRARVLASVADWMANHDVLAGHLDDALVQQAVQACQALADDATAVSILGAWLARHSRAVSWIRPILEEHRWMARHLNGDIALFAAAPDPEAAIVWAELIGHPDLDSLVDWRALCGDPKALQLALLSAMDTCVERMVCVVLECWLHQVGGNDVRAEPE